MKTTFKTKGICARAIEIEIDGNILKDVNFVGGCPGNLIGISSLVKGMELNEVITRLRGIPCGTKMTSCPDQLAIAIEEIIANQKSA